MNRRDFCKTSLLAGSTCLAFNSAAQAATAETKAWDVAIAAAPKTNDPLPDLKPAAWIWHPSSRCLQNTFILFRREIRVAAGLKSARGWISADSRYRLEVNGRRLQFGPAPCDPRWLEADPVDLTETLAAGDNVIGATVLFYGTGDGTMPIGKPGFLFWLELVYQDGSKQVVASDTQWQAHLARAWPAGHYKRWFLRSLQEEFDARFYPYGWSTPGFASNIDWRPAMLLGGSPNKPSVSTNYWEYQLDIGGSSHATELRPRTIPMLRETQVPVKQLAEHFWIQWKLSPREYFDCLAHDAYAVDRAPCAQARGDSAWEIAPREDRAASLIFEFEEQIVGWPYFTIEAPAGTTVELIVQEAHQVGGPALLNSHFNSWTRFVCREGINRFETFDFEGCRWLQLHIHDAKGKVTISQVGLRRRMYPWPNAAQVEVGEAPLQRLMNASINTLHNCAQETLVDGMGRERQQYSGDGSHQLHALYPAFGDSRLPARFMRTFSQGITLEGFFLDSWPAYDRLARLMERQLGLTGWGPILDHSVGFGFDCYHHYWYTGDLETLREPFPRLLRFAQYLSEHLGPDDLLQVENLGLPSVWMDHQAYQKQRHKQCAFNLYVSAMLGHALAPLAQALNNEVAQAEALRLSQRILRAVRRHFWSAQHACYVANLPWHEEEKGIRFCDRSLAMSVLFDQCPGGRIVSAITALATCPPHLGLSYPANAGWRLWALGKGRRPDVILQELRLRWAPMASVKLNNTLQEDWEAKPDSSSQWSHCAVVPLYIAFMTLAGIRPLTPGAKLVEIRPLLGDLDSLRLTAHTPGGPVSFAAKGKLSERELEITMPGQTEGQLVVDAREELALERIPGMGLAAYKLPASTSTRVSLKYT